MVGSSYLDGENWRLDGRGGRPDRQMAPGGKGVGLRPRWTARAAPARDDSRDRGDPTVPDAADGMRETASLGSDGDRRAGRRRVRAVGHRSAGRVGGAGHGPSPRVETPGPLRPGVRRRSDASRPGRGTWPPLRHDRGGHSTYDASRGEPVPAGTAAPAFVRVPGSGGLDPGARLGRRRGATPGADRVSRQRCHVDPSWRTRWTQARVAG